MSGRHVSCFFTSERCSEICTPRFGRGMVLAEIWQHARFKIIPFAGSNANRWCRLTSIWISRYTGNRIQACCTTRHMEPPDAVSDMSICRYDTSPVVSVRTPYRAVLPRICVEYAACIVQLCSSRASKGAWWSDPNGIPKLVHVWRFWN